MESINLDESGVSLIEVLVAVLILGVAVMGYAAVQLNAVKLTEDTYSRSQAMAIAQDAAERLRANVGEAASYVNPDNWKDVSGWSSCNDKSNPCDEAGMVITDIAQLVYMASNMLPNGSILVDTCSFNSVDADDNPIEVDSIAACITVAWAETTVANCDQNAISDGDIADNARCVVLEVVP